MVNTLLEQFDCILKKIFGLPALVSLVCLSFKKSTSFSCAFVQTVVPGCILTLFLTWEAKRFLTGRKRA